MTWKATVSSISTSADPSGGSVVTITYTDLTSTYSKGYAVTTNQDLTIAAPGPVNIVSQSIITELTELALRDAGSVSISSFVGNAYTLSSGVLQLSSF